MSTINVLDVPLSLGSEVLNLLWILLDNLGAPVLRFIENFLSMNDIFAAVLVFSVVAVYK